VVVPGHETLPSTEGLRQHCCYHGWCLRSKRSIARFTPSSGVLQLDTRRTWAVCPVRQFAPVEPGSRARFEPATSCSKNRRRWARGLADGKPFTLQRVSQQPLG
jgi:hypothetical protein